MTRLSVAVDANPLLGQRTGVGTYVFELLRALAETDLRLSAAVVARAGADDVRAQLPTGVPLRFTPVPARIMRSTWLRAPRLLGSVSERLFGAADVIHGTNYVLPPLRRRAGVVTVHDLTYLRYPRTVHPSSLTYLEHVPRAVRDGAMVCTVSASVAAEFREAYPIDADRVHVTHLGVDDAWFASRSDPAAADRLGLPPRYDLAVATIEPRKNLQLLLTAHRVAAERGLDLPPLVLVGGGGWGGELDVSGIPDQQLVRTGYLELQTLRSVVAGARRLLFPSLYEGFGLPPMEAMATGVAVIAADIPVCREVLGEHAAYVDPHDLDGWIDAIACETDVSSPKQRRAHARGFTWSACAAATVVAYEHAAQRAST